jgi:hypothetical protein
MQLRCHAHRDALEYADQPFRRLAEGLLCRQYLQITRRIAQCAGARRRRLHEPDDRRPLAH